MRMAPRRKHYREAVRGARRPYPLPMSNPADRWPTMILRDKDTTTVIIRVPRWRWVIGLRGWRRWRWCQMTQCRRNEEAHEEEHRMRAWTTVPVEEKIAWGDGPWVDEPDKCQWVDEPTGLDCLAVRNHHGSWCGYVGVPPSHPWYEKPYDDQADVHGGITFAGHCSPDDKTDPSRGICHVQEPGRPAKPWWLGFDCGHAEDIQPTLEARERKAMGDDYMTSLASSFHPTYRTLGYVQGEVANLAASAKTAEQGGGVMAEAEMDEGIKIGAPPPIGAVVIGRAPATLIVWPCGCARIGGGTFTVCADHQPHIFDLIDGAGEVAGILNRK